MRKTKTTPTPGAAVPRKKPPVATTSAGKTTVPDKKASSKAASLGASPEAAFLRELESLGVSERWRRVVDMGRLARGNRDGCEMQLLLRLSQMTLPYEREIGAIGLWQAECTTETLRLARDPCDRVARLAVFQAENIIPDSDVLRLFEELPLHLLPQLCKRLEKARKAEALVDQYFATMQPDSRKTAISALLPWASVKTLSAQPAAFVHLLDKRGWHTLARRCPDFAVEFVLKELQDNHMIASRRNRAHIALTALRRYHPFSGLRLLEEMLCCMPVENMCTMSYAIIFPDAVATLVIKYNVKRALCPWKLQRKISPEMFLKLFDAGALYRFSLTELFVVAPPNLRSVLYKQHRNKLLNTDGSMQPSVVAMITDPTERERETLRMLNDVEAVRMDLSLWAGYLITLPFPQAVKLSEPHLRHQDVNIRGCICNAIVRTGLYHSEYIDDILDFCITHNRDNDIVRRRIILQLSEIPPSRWKEQHFPKLAEILKGVSDARDVSTRTCENGAMMVLKVAQFSTRLVDTSLSSILCRCNVIFNLETLSLPKTAVLKVWACLLPYITKLRDENEDFELISILTNFGTRLRDVDRSAADFLRSLCNSSSDMLAEFGIETLLKYFRPIALKTMPELLNTTVDWINVDAVRSVVSTFFHGKLLEKYIVPLKMQGRFGSPKGTSVVAFTDGHNWSAAKQHMYAKSITHLFETKTHKVRNEELLIASLGSLHSANITDMVAPFVQLGYANIPRRDWILEMLGSLNDAASLELLVSALEDERSCVAIYPFQRRLRRLSTTRVLQLVETAASSTKVTVLKGVVLIVGNCRDEVAYEYLKKMEQENKLHIDVRIAWLYAMRGFLHKQDAWDAFYRAAESKKSALAIAVTKMLGGEFEEDWQHACVCKLFCLLLSHDDCCVKIAALRRLVDNPIQSFSTELLNCVFQTLEYMHLPDFLHFTLRALVFSNASSTEIASHLAGVEDDWKLKRIVNTVEGLFSDPSPCVEHIIVSLVEELISKRRQPSLICSLICLLPPKLMEGFLDDLLRKGLLHAGAAVQVVNSVCSSLSDLDGGAALEKKLRTHSEAVMQRIGLALLSAVASAREWDSVYRDALAVYSQSEHQWVSDDARLVRVNDL